MESSDQITTTVDAASADSPSNSLPAGSAIEQAFFRILRGIVSGDYPTGARLPPERELAQALGASRPTVREVLRRLAEWRVVEPRRSSGSLVLDIAEWSIEVLPGYLRHLFPDPEQPGVVALFTDLLRLRRVVSVDIVRAVSERNPRIDLSESRRALAEAWAARGEPQRFRHADLNVLRSLARAARLLPALWLLNRLSAVYDEIAEWMAVSLPPSEDYLEVHRLVFEAIERGDSQTATVALDGYLDRHESRVRARLEQPHGGTSR